MIYFYRYVLPIANILYARVYVWIVYCLHRIIRRKNVLYTSLVPTFLYFNSFDTYHKHAQRTKRNRLDRRKALHAQKKEAQIFSR